MFYLSADIIKSCIGFLHKVKTMILFSVFSLYIILSYGFEYFSRPNFSLTFVNSSLSRVRVGERVTLVCRADNYWEWCR